MSSFLACHALYSAYQVARGIADMHDVEDDGYASIAHSKSAHAFISYRVSFAFTDFSYKHIPHWPFVHS